MNLATIDTSKDFPNGGRVYLNNASVSLMPFSSIEEMKDFLVKYNSIGSDSLESDELIKEKFITIRKSISNLLNCKPEEVILTQSTTDGINFVANGLSTEKSSNIIIRGMNHEHHANYFPWLRLSKKLELKNLRVDKNGFFEFNELKKFVNDKTKLVALSHALYNTGAILPVEEIGEFLEKRNIPFFLDTAQTVGCIGNYDFKRSKSNFMSFNGSKWLCGPMGIGIFYCQKDSSVLLEPTAIGGESAMIYDETELAFKDIPEKFQTGFRNYSGMVGLESSISYLMKFGLENIRNKVIKLANILRDELAKINEIEIHGPDDEKQRTSIVSFSLKGKNPQSVVEELEKKKIILAVREIFDKKIVRASPHFFNTENEVLKVVESVKQL